MTRETRRSLEKQIHALTPGEDYADLTRLDLASLILHLESGDLEEIATGEDDPTVCRIDGKSYVVPEEIIGVLSQA